MAQIEDFGQKIGGARKDVWKKNGITANDFAEMNDLERNTYVKKDNIWIKPDWEKLIADGTPQTVAYWQSKMRQSLPPKPPKSDEETLQKYVSVISQVRDAVMAVKDQKGVEEFYRNYLIPTFTYGNSYWHSVNNDVHGIITSKVLNASQTSYRKLEREANEKLFGIPKEDRAYVAAKQDLEIYFFDKEKTTLEKDTYDPSSFRLTVKTNLGRTFFYIRSDNEFYDMDKWQENTYFVIGKNRKPLKINFPTREEAEEFVDSFARASQIAAEINAASNEKVKEDSNRKQNFVPPQLAHVRYTGPSYRGIRSATSQMFLDDLKFRGGEFGNWLNNADRQTSLDMGYDALRNLAEILKVPPEDISLNGKLAIAFGARGRGGPSAGAAHYEPLRQVINLTKMSGAGCLAHEWFHALDHAIGLEFGANGFASEAKRGATRKIPDSFMHLMTSLKYKEAVVSAEEQKQEFAPKIKNAERNLRNWIDSTKPSKLPDDLSKAWEAAKTRILENPDTFCGGEYFGYSWSTADTHPDVEQLSQISKFATNHVIPRASKQQFVLWAKELSRFKAASQEVSPRKRSVKTDFLKDSEEFDKIFSKYGHGYWSSDCEMLARAFDCYISDKIKEQGYHSDYLSSHADSFSIRDGDRLIAAYPRDEERTVINKAFDTLFEELKELQFLHDAPVVEELTAPEESKTAIRREEPDFSEPEKSVRYEQLSLDEILFAASARAGQATSGRHGNLSDRSR